jgi:23S rRNA (uridine2552-2'-O)-methyltransferase
MGGGAVFLALGRGQEDLGHEADYPRWPEPAPGGDNTSMKVRTQSKKVDKAWLNQHINDTYVKLAQKEGYRARAAYKLKEIDEALGLVRPGDQVVDLGSTPGAWSQYLRRRLSPGGAATGAQRPAAGEPAEDPWGSAPASGSFGGNDDEPPF